MVIESTATTRAHVWSVADAGKKRIITVSFAGNRKSDRNGTSKFTILTFPRFDHEVELKTVDHPNTEELETDKENRRRLAEALRELRRKHGNDLRSPEVVVDPGTIAIAKKVAISQDPLRQAWEILIAAGVLTEPMKLAEAIQIRGRPTHRFELDNNPRGKSAAVVDWYFNPANRHVAPGLRAQLGKDRLLSKWQIVRK